MFVTLPSGPLGGTFRGLNLSPARTRRHVYVLARVTAVGTGLLRPARTHLMVMTDDEPQIMTGEQVADLLQVSPRTIEEWRQARSGPPYRRMGRHVRYLRREVLAWFEGLNGDA